MRRLTSAALLSTLFLAGLAGPAAAQGKTELEKKLEAKLAEDWFQANDWTADYDEARERARETGKPIFAYFTRSYAY